MWSSTVVVTVVRELDAEAPLLAAPLALELTREDLAAEHVDLVQLRHQLAVEQLVDAFGW